MKLNLVQFGAIWGWSCKVRKPMVRALKAAQQLRAEADSASGNLEVAALQPVAASLEVEATQP